MRTLQVLGNSEFGGATRLVCEWCKYLINQGWLVDVLTTNARSISEFEKIAGVRILKNIFIPREIRIFEDFKAILNLILLVKKEKYEVIHTYTATPGFIGRLAGKLSRVKRIFHHQAGWTIGQYSTPFENFIFKRLEWFSASISTNSICVGKGVAQEAKENKYIPGNKIVVIRNGIDPNPFISEDISRKNEFREQLSIPYGNCVIVSTSRLSKQKDLPSLIKAVDILKKNTPSIGINLLLVGDGPERENLEKLVSDLNLWKEIKFIGFRDDIPLILQGSDIFVSTTLREGLSISILEAMASSKPIIVTDILENQELIENGVTGLQIPVYSPEKIVEAIERYITDADFASSCGRKACEKVIKEFSISRMFEETYRLYVD